MDRLTDDSAGPLRAVGEGGPGVVDPGVVRTSDDRTTPAPAGEVGHLVALGTTTPLDGVAALAADLVGADLTMVSVRGRGHEFLLGVGGGVAAPIDDPGALPLEGSICTVVRAEGITVAVDDVAADPRFDTDQLPLQLGVRACAGAPIHADDGSVIGAVCAASTTPRHWRRSDLHALEALARAAQRELDRAVDWMTALDRAQELALVVGRLRHELSGDLTVVLGGIETALHPSVTDEIRVRALTNARTDALRVIDVMDALLRTDARTSVRSRVTTLEQMLVDSTRALDESARRRVSMHHADVRVEVAGRLLTRVIANLVDNALKHSAGLVRIEASAGADAVVVGVADQGPGFRREALEQLFEPFTAGHDPADDQGFGLGLFIVRELVERLEGDIDVESTAHGSTVTVTAPARVVARGATGG